MLITVLASMHVLSVSDNLLIVYSPNKKRKESIKPVEKVIDKFGTLTFICVTSAGLS